MRDCTPATVTAEADVVARAEAALRAAGWTVVPSFELADAPFDLSNRRIACSAYVGAIDDVASAVLAAVRGAAVVARCDEPELAEMLADDLARVTTVDRSFMDAERAPAGPLDPEQRRVLELLARGATIGEVAAELYLSTRTAERRLAAARRALGVRTTAEALREFRCGRCV